MAVIEVKEKEIFNKEDIQVKESNERLRTEQRDLDKQAKLIEIGIEKTETLSKRSTSAEIIQVDKSLNTTFQEEVTNREKQLKAFVDSFRWKRIINGQNRHRRNRCFQNIYQQN